MFLFPKISFFVCVFQKPFWDSEIVILETKFKTLLLLMSCRSKLLMFFCVPILVDVFTVFCVWHLSLYFNVCVSLCLVFLFFCCLIFSQLLFLSHSILCKSVPVDGQCLRYQLKWSESWAPVALQKLGRDPPATCFPMTTAWPKGKHT